MIPSAATKSGIDRVDMIELNADGYAVQQTTSTKINQTWFASQTGPIACRAWSRVAFGPARPPLEKSVQMPAPKSAPASTT